MINGSPEKPHTCTAGSNVLIGVFNTMWRAPLDESDLPPCCRLTTDLEEFSHADAVVYHIPSLHGDLLPARPDQLRVAWSMESVSNYSRLGDPAFIKQFDLTMTYRLDSDIPVLYLSQYQAGDGVAPALRMPPPPKTPGKLVSMFISSRMNKSGRDAWVAELMKHLDVHSYGKQRTNRHVSGADRGPSTKLHTIAQYKFDLAFENSVDDDYVTEKFYDPLICGTVPVYLGASNIDHFAPGESCFINTADFANPRELAEYLLFLGQNGAAYAEYFAWKKKPFLLSFQRMAEQQPRSGFARLCDLIREWRRAVDDEIEVR